MSPLPFLLLATLTPSAQAEGWADLDGAAITPSTDLYVDIRTRDERIVWRGIGAVGVTDPEGVSLGEYESGEFIEPTSTGTYQLDLHYTQNDTWDVTVSNAADEGGRLSSDCWDFDTDVWDEDSALSNSFYALVPSADGERGAVIELDTYGLAGREWRIAANAAGVTGRDAGRSVSQYRQKYDPQYRLYLQPPSIATYTTATPHGDAFSVTHDESSCDGVAPGFAAASFTFESDSGGSWHIVCDIDGNGEFDLSTNIDAARSGAAVVGTNEVRWYGRDNEGEPLPPGTYECQLTITAGEVHFIADDIETAYPGVRTYKVRRDGERSPLPMFWNDYAIQENALEMPDGRYSPVSSGLEGMDPGGYDTMPGPGVNTHPWGNWSEEGKGDFAFIDTFTWLDATTVDSLDVTVVDVETDLDEDGTPDACQLNYYRGGCSSAPTPPLALLTTLLGLLSVIPLRRLEHS